MLIEVRPRGLTDAVAPLRDAAEALRSVADARREVLAPLGSAPVVQESLFGAVPPMWRSPAGISYEELLDETGDRLRGAAAAYRAAGDLLLPYARALDEVHHLVARADGLEREAAAASQRFALLAVVGPDPGEGLRAAARGLRSEAEDLERVAAARCAAALRDGAARAPAAGSWAGTSRFVGDVLSATAGAAAGVGALAAAGFRSLPFVGDSPSRSAARGQVADTAIEAMRVWETPAQMWHDVMDGRAGLAAGALGMAFTPGIGRFRIRDPHLAHKEALREDRWRALLKGHQIQRPSAQALLERGVSLRNEEARGGHTLREHVAASRSYLGHRTRQGRPAASSFPDVQTAERAINAVLAAHVDQVRSFDARGRGSLVLVAEVPDCRGFVVVPGSTRTARTQAVLVVLKIEGGAPHVLTAYPIR